MTTTNLALSFDEGRVVAYRAAGHIHEKTLLAARVDAFAAAQWEVVCELELGDGRCVQITIDVDTAAALGLMLIARAALSRKASNDDFDAQLVRYMRRTGDSEDVDDEIPF